jgi:chemotaxis protein histidine kinase CheA/CheY-like chemotaxis protein
MTSPATDPGLSDRLAVLAHDWEDVRDGVSGQDSARWRGALEALAEDLATADRAAAASALRRLALLSEVWECLRSHPERATAAGEVASFCTNALLALTIDRRAASRDSAEPAEWILQQSDERWNDYLALLDPAANEIVSLEDPRPPEEDAVPGEDLPPEIDAQALLRLFAGREGSTGPSRTRDGEAEFSGSIEDAASWPAPTTDVQVDAQGRDAMATAGVAFDPTPEHQARSKGEPGVDLPPLPARFDLDLEMREAFLADASELFERIEHRVVGLAGESDPGDALRELARCFHTLKGAAGSVGLGELATAVHQLEERLGQVSGRVSEDLSDLLHKFVGYLDDLIGVLRRGAQVLEPAPCTPGVASAQRTPGAAPAESGRTTIAATAEGLIRVASGRFDELTDLAGELIVQGRFWISQAERTGTIAALARAARNRLLASVERLHELGAGPGGQGPLRNGALRSDSGAELRRLTEQADDLSVLAESAQAAASTMGDRADLLTRLSHQLWDSFQSLRIVSVRGLFHRLARVLHEAARVEERIVEVAMLGEETGADRGIQDKAFEPLLHLVRNSVGHGIEPPAERVRAGKPPAGRVTLAARREGNALVIAVEDDGKGLDDTAIAAKARLLGWLAPDESPSPERLHSFVFQPGFSTKSHANAISGRGVGMDVVAREVGKLGGTIELTSRKGLGTRVTLRLPSQLALEPALIVRIAGAGFAIPASQIESAQPFDRPVGSARSAAENDGSGAGAWLSSLRSVPYHDQVIPVVFGRETLGFSRDSAPPWPKLVVVRAGSELLALVVDAIERTEDLVVKPLGALLAGHPLISGTSLSVNGELISVLDPRGLEQWRRLLEVPECDPSRKSPVPEGDTTRRGERSKVLVVDDSVSVRRGLARQLRRMGLEVQEVSDGMEALGRLRGSGFGLVVTDLEMPRLDGIALLAEMKRSTVLAAIPVVVASTLADAETRRRVRDLGADAFLCKPVNPSELARTVEPLLTGVGR